MRLVDMERKNREMYLLYKMFYMNKYWNNNKLKLCCVMFECECI